MEHWNRLPGEVVDSPLNTQDPSGLLPVQPATGCLFFRGVGLDDLFVGILKRMKQNGWEHI